MIRINDDWVILVDEYNYTLARDLHKKTVKTKGQEPTDAYKTEGYYSGVSDALKGLADKLVKDELKDGVWGLYEAVNAIQKVYTDLAETISGKIPDEIEWKEC